MQAAHNPYEPPRSNVAMPSEPMAPEVAGRGRRFGTFVVDYIGVLAILAAGAAVAMMLYGEHTVVAFIDDWADLGVIPVMFVYYALFEGIWARSPGKWLFGTIVVREDGTKPSLGQVLGRSACRFIPFEPLSGFTKLPWHDRIPGTRVVRSRRN